MLGSIVSGFLWTYVSRYSGPVESVVPHLALIASGTFVLAALRLAVWRLPLPTELRSLASGLTLATGVLLLIGYYLLVLGGLESWGRVITWRLIRTYSSQACDLLQVFGIPCHFAAALALLLATGVVWVACLWTKRWDWPRNAAASLTGASVTLCLVGSMLILGAKTFEFMQDPPVAEAEPLALTFFPDRATPRHQSHGTVGTHSSRARDERIRADYQATDLRTRPNVILLVGDALRGDHLGVTGYSRPTTPFLSRVDAAGRLRAARAMRSVCAESSCGLMAIAQSRFVHEMSSSALTLAEVLKAHGYRTMAILGGDHTNFYGLKESYRGIDQYFDGAGAVGFYMNDDRLVLDRIRQLPAWDGTPQFLQLHLMSSHGVGTRFRPPDYEPWKNYYNKLGRLGARQSVTDEEAVNYYDNGIRQFDEVVGSLLDALEEKEYLNDALVIITGDHGELLGEGGEYAHARGVSEQELHIPFLFIGYGRPLAAWPHADALASQVDIAPTILAEIGMPPPRGWSGQPLQRAGERPFVPFQQAGWIGLYDVRDPTMIWKYWHNSDRSEEFVRALDANGAELSDQPSQDARLVPEWRMRTLAATAGVVEALPP